MEAFKEVFDLIIVGGGIVGCGAYRDATLRGMKVALLEKQDFAYGTSSRSSKLIHGGLRYLEMLDLRLVFEACQERNLLRKLAPYLVRPLAFLYPVYRSRISLYKVRAGLTLYDLLSTYRNIRPHAWLTCEEVRKDFPSLKTRELRGALKYYDAFEDDARLVVENLKSLPSRNPALNYFEVMQIERQKDGLFSVAARDQFSGESLNFLAHSVLVAAGPWAEEVARRAGIRKKMLRLSKGVHLVIPRKRLPVPYAAVMHALSDQRVVFAIPWGNKVIVGTTDTEFDGSPDEATCSLEDMNYLLETVNDYFPEAKLGAEDVLSSFAGIRPLHYQEGVSTYRTSREHFILEKEPGLFFLIGGKYTTFRLIAAECIDRIAAFLKRRLGKAYPGCKTSNLPFSGGTLEAIRSRYRSDDPLFLHLVSRYGLEGIKDYERWDPEDKKRIVPDSWICVKEIKWAVEREWAKTVEDVLLRRTRLGILSAYREQAAEAIAERMAELLSWSKDRKERELRKTKETLRRFYPSGEEIKRRAQNRKR